MVLSDWLCARLEADIKRLMADLQCLLSDWLCARLEADIKRLKADLQLSRNTEQELKTQIGALSMTDRATKNELYQLRQDNESLQSK